MAISNFIKSKVYANDKLEEHFGEYLNNKYEPAFPQLAYDILAKPGTQEMVAKACGVTVRTIQRWKCPVLENGDPNPLFKEEFAKKYLHGLIAQKAGYDVIALDNLQHPNKHFNPALYFGERKRLHRHTEDRLVEIPELKDKDDYAECAKVLRDKFSEGVLSSQEFNKAASALHKITEVIEIAQLKAQVEELKKLMGSMKITGVTEDEKTQTN